MKKLLEVFIDAFETNMEDLIETLEDNINELEEINPVLATRVENILEFVSVTIMDTFLAGTALFTYPVFKSFIFLNRNNKKEEDYYCLNGEVDESEFECGVEGKEHLFD